MSKTVTVDYLGEGKWLEGWDRKGPDVETLKGTTAYCVRHTGWLDHPKRFRRVDGTTVYVSEPYDIGTEGLRSLARLMEDGWQVSLYGSSQHYPGRTFMIAVWRDRP